MAQVDSGKLAKLPPLARAKAAAALMDEHRQAMAALGAIRAGALRAMRDQGMSAIQIAEALEVSRQQVHRLLREAGAEEGEDSTLSVREAAARLGLPPRRVYELIDEGRLPAVKRGREIRITAASLDQPGTS